MSSINGNVIPKLKWKSSKCSSSSEEYYKKGLEVLNPSTRKFFASLKVAPKVLFVELHQFDNHSSNGCLYKLRKKSTIQFLTPSEVKQIAKQDVKLMYNIIKRKIFALGKLVTSNVEGTLLKTNPSMFTMDCKICKQKFSEKADFLNHITTNHSKFSLKNCTVCEKKFVTLSTLKHHMEMSHPTVKNSEIRSDSHEFDKNSNRNPLSELSMMDQNKSFQMSFRQEKSNNVTKPADCNKELLAKCQNPNKILSSYQWITKSDKELEKVCDDFSYEIMCCMCLKIICEIKPLCISLSNNICQICPYCGLRLSSAYFEHHIATIHLVCNQEECHSQYVKTGYKLRKVLAMQAKLKCIHVNCDRNVCTNLKEFILNSTAEELESNQISNDAREIHQENKTTEMNLEKLKNELQNIEEFREENCPGIKLTSKTEPNSDIKEMGECFEKNQVLSNNSDPSNSVSIHSCFDKSDEIQVNSNELHFRCCICKTNFQKEQKLLKHLFNRHRFSHPFTCDICFFCYKDVKDLEIHVQLHDKELVLENMKSQNYNFVSKISSVTSNTAENIEVTLSQCESTESHINFSEEAIKKEPKYTSKECKLKIPCIVEKVEYPLDIHNLYAHIRKADNPTEVNSSELRLQSSFSTDDNTGSIDIGTFSSEESSKKRKFFDSPEMLSKRVEMNDHVEGMESNMTEKNFQCNTCEKIFDSKRSYSEHMFFVHDADFDDSVIHDLLKPSSNEKEIIGGLQNTECETGKLKILKFPQNSEISASKEDLKLKNFKSISAVSLETMSAKSSEFISLHACHDCNKRFLTNTMLEKHRRVIHLEVSRKDSIKKKIRVKRPGGKDKKKDLLINVKQQSDTQNEKISSLTCPICKFTLQTPRRLQAHLMVNHSKVTDNCLLCNKLFAFGRGIRHMLDFHIIPSCKEKKEQELSWNGDPKRDVEEAIQVLGKKRLLAICDYDNYTTLNDFTSFQCRSCSSSYSAVRYYRNHYIQKHDKLCALCDCHFRSNEEFLLHLDKIHYSVKHYLWFTDTFISTILQTERHKENFSESLVQIIKRKISENEADTALQSLKGMEEEKVSINTLDCLRINQITEIQHNLPQTTCELPMSTVTLSLPESQHLVESYEETHGVPATITKLYDTSSNSNVLEFPDFCMEYEITENETIVMHCDNDLQNEVFVGNLCDKKYTNGHDKSKLANNSTVLESDVPNCIFDYSVNINESSTNNLKKNIMLTEIETSDTDNHILGDIELEERE